PARGTGLRAPVASMIAVATGTSQFVWWVVLAALANLYTLRPRESRRRPRVDPWIVVASVMVLAAAAYPLIDVGVRNVGWDGRSIWLLHSRWFFAGGDYARVAMQNPVYLFSHPEYPPFVPATVATVWRMSGTIDLWVGQVVISLLDACVVARVGLAVVRRVRGGGGIGGGDYARVAMQNPVYLFSHPEYPPFVPATVATVWRMSGTIDLWVGQVVISLLNACVVALVGLAFVRLVRGRLVIGAGAVGAGVCLVVYLFSDGYAINAYADVLAAAATTAAALYLLVLPGERGNAMVGLLCGAVAGTTKNEAAPVVLGVLVLAPFRHREVVRAWLAAAVAEGALCGHCGLVTR